jgi:hypothetical protein
MLACPWQLDVSPCRVPSCPTCQVPSEWHATGPRPSGLVVERIGGGRLQAEPDRSAFSLADRAAEAARLALRVSNPHDMETECIYYSLGLARPARRVGPQRPHARPWRASALEGEQSPTLAHLSVGVRLPLADDDSVTLVAWQDRTTLGRRRATLLLPDLRSRTSLRSGACS